MPALKERGPESAQIYQTQECGDHEQYLKESLAGNGEFNDDALEFEKEVVGRHFGFFHGFTDENQGAAGDNVDVVHKKLLCYSWLGESLPIARHCAIPLLNGGPRILGNIPSFHFAGPTGLLRLFVTYPPLRHVVANHASNIEGVTTWVIPI